MTGRMFTESLRLSHESLVARAEEWGADVTLKRVIQLLRTLLIKFSSVMPAPLTAIGAEVSRDRSRGKWAQAEPNSVADRRAKMPGARRVPDKEHIKLSEIE